LPVKVLQCGHPFHEDCIAKWPAGCPLRCRPPVVDVEERERVWPQPMHEPVGQVAADEEMQAQQQPEAAPAAPEATQPPQQAATGQEQTQDEQATAGQEQVHNEQATATAAAAATPTQGEQPAAATSEPEIDLEAALTRVIDEIFADEPDVAAAVQEAAAPPAQ